MTALCLALVLSQAPTPAADTVLLVRSSDEVFEERLAAELHAAGFRVEDIEIVLDASGDIPGQLAHESEAQNALAAMAFVARADGRIDVWVADRVTSKVVTRTWDAPISTRDRATLALEAVELLQASLVEVQWLAPKERAQVPPVAEAAVRSRFREKPFAPHGIFGTGVGLFVTPGGLRPQPLLEIQIGFAFSEAFAFDVQVASSFWPVHLDEPQGSADVGLGFLRVFAVWSPIRSGSITLGPSVSTGALLIYASGSDAAAGLETRLDARVAWLLSAGLQLAYRVNEGIRAELLMSAGACVPALGVQIGTTPIATAGQPVLDFVLRFEFE